MPDALDAPDAGLAGSGCVCDAAGAGWAADAGCAREAADAGDSTDEDEVATGDDASDAANADRSTSTEIGSVAASQIHAAAARERQRGFANRRVKLEGIICSKPSADPAAACCCCERRIFRASHRHVRRIECARRRRLFAAEPGAVATRSVRWRLMSRQALHFTRPYRNRQGGKSWFCASSRFVSTRFRSRFHCVAGLLVGRSRSIQIAVCFARARLHLQIDSDTGSFEICGTRRTRDAIAIASHACRLNGATRVRDHRLLRDGFERDALSARPHESDRGHYDHHRARNEREYTERTEALQHGRDHE